MNNSEEKNRWQMESGDELFPIEYPKWMKWQCLSLRAISVGSLITTFYHVVKDHRNDKRISILNGIIKPDTYP